MPRSYQYPVTPHGSSKTIRAGKRPFSIGVCQGNMVQISNYKVCCGPVTEEEWDYLFDLGFLKRTDDGQFHEVETEPESDADDIKYLDELSGSPQKFQPEPSPDIIKGSTPHVNTFVNDLHASRDQFSSEPSSSPKKNDGRVPTPHSELVDSTPQLDPDIVTQKCKKNSLSGKLMKKTGKLVRVFRKK